ncbi:MULTISPECIES: helix-turn-helix domain-containing protein [unclassified Ectothiorhodospira]|uniref:helix-turn-helix domain-containing protein n=1 Tax=unclassified Ectothiorhodospira TaxID=2684909 RepID=UPI001EE99F68|nr:MULTISPECIES: helix-turn-helix transcriptional regulator [unclassified Ectothiorhodospira]MCG5516377.1 helix-turn-helix domain-containing protein [Ectothiorhodospira sp. 9100]MCG5519373.1 helix-turn-helix domain-containing protein [Ectothiorhodospira sp. 9905]
MTDFLDRWAAESPENARLVAQERLITQVTEALWQEMEEAGVNKADLAARMGTTRGYVSQILSGSRNMTLRTLSDICFALRKEADISLHGAEADGWESGPVEKLTRSHPRIRYQETGNVVEPMDHWKTAA